MIHVQGRIARRHKIKKNVQFILWYARQCFIARILIRKQTITNKQ